MSRFAICLAASLVILSSPARGDDDPIRATVEKAKREYEQSLSEYREQANVYFDKREEAARQQGNKKLVDQIKASRAAFEKSGELPSTAPATLRGRPQTALRLLTVAYTQAVENYTRKKQDDLAAATEMELADIKAKAGFPSIAGVWQEGPKENQIQVIVTQEAEKFRANCKFQDKKAGEIRWQMTGTISKDGEIKGRLITTKAPRGWVNQVRTGKFSATDGTITGRAEFDGGGGHDFEWKLVE